MSLTIDHLLGIPWQERGYTPKTGFSCYGLIRWIYGEAGLSLPDSLIDATDFVASCGLAASPRHELFRPVGFPMQMLDVLVFKLPGTEIRHLGCALNAQYFAHCALATNGVARGDLLRGPWRRLLTAVVRYQGDDR